MLLTRLRLLLHRHFLRRRKPVRHIKRAQIIQHHQYQEPPRFPPHHHPNLSQHLVSSTFSSLIVPSAWAGRGPSLMKYDSGPQIFWKFVYVNRDPRALSLTALEFLALTISWASDCNRPKSSVYAAYHNFWIFCLLKVTGLSPLLFHDFPFEESWSGHGWPEDEEDVVEAKIFCPFLPSPYRSQTTWSEEGCLPDVRR